MEYYKKYIKNSPVTFFLILFTLFAVISIGHKNECKLVVINTILPIVQLHCNKAN